MLLGAFVMYLLYGRKRDPLQTHADRMRMISGVANFYAWMLIVTSIFLSLNIAQKLLDLEKWGPFAGTPPIIFAPMTASGSLTKLLSSTSTGRPRSRPPDIL
jgi:hypothetical protein